MTTIPLTKARATLSEIFSDVCLNHKRIILERHGHERVAIVPIEDLEDIERRRKKIAIAAEEAFNESDKRVPWAEVRKELDL